MAESPLVTVVLPTRNRAGRIATAVDSVLACRPAPAVVVVDQSSDLATEEALQSRLSNGSVTYVRTGTTGVAAARNLGVALAQTPIVAFTDDDCVVAPNWLEALAQPFARFPRVAAVFGTVLAGPHDPGRTLVISYRRTGEFVGRSIRDKSRLEAMGANMAVRVSAFTSLGGFDEMLGTGSRFRAAEELDFVMRALQAGHHICETDRAIVIHHGARDRADKDRLARDYLYGIGAAYGKHLKCRRWSVLHPLGNLAGRWMFGRPVVDYGSAPSKPARLAGFVSGFVAAIRTPVDSARAKFTA